VSFGFLHAERNGRTDGEDRFNALPEGETRDPEAYKTAIAKLPKGSAVIIFTPDSTHYPIAKLALESGHHVMVTKPATQLLEHHQELSALAASKGLVCWVEQ
jgi:D-galacturonate reductase